MKWYAMAAICVLLIGLYGCEAPPDAVSAGSAPNDADARSTDREEDRDRDRDRHRGTEPVSTVVDGRPAALVDGRGIMWGELRRELTEAAGAQILRELILDRRVRDAILEAGIGIGPDALARERMLMLQSLHEEPNTAIRLLEELRKRQGLGERRFNALLRRNASLRALVRDDVEITDNMVRRTFETLHGPKRQPRLITVASLSKAQQLRERLVERDELFSDLAAEYSTDESAARGGLLEPISRSDPSYPEALLQELWALEPGAVSDPILLDEQYALITLVRQLPGDDVDFEDVREDMARRTRLQQERLRMDQLARRLLRDVTVTIFDEALKDSWERSR
ncbi:MAG: peptidylprolyl isomerase [Phycisphaerales bacterium]|nr:MAG: peptidylprolyl isomerase [Phycisphaerales bacterium]